MKVMHGRTNCFVVVTSLMFTVLLLASSPATDNEPLAMIIDLEGTAQIRCEGVYREAGIASDLYPDETLFLTIGKMTLLMLDSMEKMEIAAPAEIVVQPEGLKPMAGSTVYNRGTEELLVAGANLEVFAKAIGTAGVLRDIGHETAPMPLEEDRFEMQDEAPMQLEGRSAPMTLISPQKPGARTDSSSIGDLSSGSETERLRESDSIANKEDEGTGTAGYRKKKESKIRKPAVWVFNSFYDPAFMVFACDEVYGARYYTFMVYAGNKLVKDARSLAPYLEVSKRELKHGNQRSYTLIVRIIGREKQRIAEKTTMFIMPDNKDFAKLKNFFSKPPVVRGLLLENANMLREALYLYKTTAHLNPGMADGLTGRIRKLENRLNDR